MPKRTKNREVLKKEEKPKKGKMLASFFTWLGILFLLAILGGLSLFIYFAKDLPRPERFFAERPFIESTKIFDRTGKVLLYELYGEEKREVIPLNKIPQHLINAVIAAEDANFYKHRGIDFRGITRSFFANIQSRDLGQGGSTISQQLIRSSMLSTEKTVTRKIREIILTLELERKYSKDQIMEFYLNQVPFGSNAYGVQAASLTYFGKPASETSVAESAALVALLRSPSRLSPYGENKDQLLKTKDSVLERMAQEGFLSPEELQESKSEEITFSKAQQLIRAPHFTMYVKNYLETKYGEEFLREKGLKVYTSIDYELQEEAEKIVREGALINRGNRAYNAALVAINPRNGEVLSMVGSASFFEDPLPAGCSPGKNCLFEPYPNVAIRERQPGSSFKPIVYATAFKKGYNPDTIVMDEFRNFGGPGNPYVPQNYDGLFRGPVTLRNALAQSLNAAAVSVLADLAGLEDSIKTAKELGITTLNNPPSFYGLPLVLGGGEVKLLDMVSVYGVFATEGLRAQPVTVLKIVDSQGNILEENSSSLKRVLTPEVAQMINSILSDNNARGPVMGYNSAMYFENANVSAKTGTTTDYRDGWIIGYTPKISVGVWAGNNDNTSILREPGLFVSGPIWRNFMNLALQKLGS